MIERVKYFCEDKIRNSLKEIDDLKPKINSLIELEKKLKKKFREINEN
jgi:hypothetical protein